MNSAPRPGPAATPPTPPPLPEVPGAAAPPAAFLTALRQELARALAGADERAQALALARDAKRVRPLLLQQLAAALGVGADEPALVRAAAAVELIHTASLIHDDVIDVSTERRGLPSVNAELGNAAAVLVGDEVLCRALTLLEPPLVAPCLRAVADMTQGALQEIAAAGDVSLGLDAWRAIAAGKTGALFGLCGTLAALLSRDPQCAARWAEAGTALGVAFQAADDVADLLSGNDLDEKNPNVAILAGAQANADLRARLLQAWARGRATAPERDALVRGVMAAGGARRALEVAQQALDHARRCFGDDTSRGGVLQALAAGDAFVSSARRAA